MKLQRFESENGDGSKNGVVFVFWCPGCEERHTFTTERDRKPVWVFDGNMEHPTFSPSLLYPDKTPCCHLYLKAGKLEFLSDCGHSLAGKTVDLPEIPTDMVM